MSECARSSSAVRATAALWLTLAACTSGSITGAPEPSDRDDEAGAGGNAAAGRAAAGSSGGAGPSAGGSVVGGSAGQAQGDLRNDAEVIVARDAGASDAAAASIPGGKRAVVAVGYGGVRALSIDDGKTWTKTGEDQPNGGDDGNLLRSIAYGNGVWVAGGWNKWWTSSDGKAWTLRTHNFGIMQGMAFGGGFFLASEMNGAIYKSTDGMAWERVGRANTGKHTELAYGNGTFAAWGADNSVVETSTDGVTWQRVSLGSAAYCGGDAFRTVEGCFVTKSPGAWAPDVFVRAEWKGIILRSVDGKKWTQAWTYPANAFDALAFGYVPE